MEKIKLAKKVLIVSSWAPPQISGSAHFLYNLFSNFEENNYYILTSKRNFSSNNKNDEKILSGKYFFFEDGEIFKIPLFPYTYTDKTTSVIKVYQKIRRGLLKTMRAYSIIRSGLKIIKNEQIEIIMGTSDIGKNFLLTLILSKLSGKPYIMFMSDLYKENSFSGVWKIFVSLRERIFFRYARTIITFSEEVCDMYKVQYGKNLPCEVIRQSLDKKPVPLKETSSPKNYAEIIFTGNIYWAQQESLENMIKAVDTIDDINLRFTIYAPDVPKTTENALTKHNLKGKTKITSASYEKIPNIQSSADILFLPLSWYTKNESIVRTAIPYKLIEYMVAGKPILIHAPFGSFVNKYAQKNNFALVVEENNIESLQSAVRKLLLDKEYAKKLAETALATFLKNHRADVNAHKLANIIGKD